MKKAIGQELYKNWRSGTMRPFAYPTAEELWSSEAMCDQAEAWESIAEKSIGILANHGADQISHPLTKKIAKVLIYFALGASGAGLFTTVQGCGHQVELSKDAATISKEGSSLSYSNGVLSFSQNAPQVQPVIINKEVTK